MKFKILFFIFILCPLFFFPQKDTSNSKYSPGYVGLLLGPALPLGDYVDNGLAKTGFNAEISLQIPIKKQFGVCGIYKYIFNPINLQSATFGLSSNYHTITSSTPWKIHTGLAGCYYSFNLTPSSAGNRGMSIDIRGAGGVSYVTSPDVSLIVTYQGVTRSSEMSSDNSLQFCYLFSAGFRKGFGDVAFKVGVEYLGARATFQNITITSGAQTLTQPVSQNISILLINAGVCLTGL